MVGLKEVAIRMRTRLCANYLDGVSSGANNNLAALRCAASRGRNLGNSPLLHRFPAFASGVHGAAAGTRDSRQPGGIHTSGAKPSRSSGWSRRRAAALPLQLLPFIRADRKLLRANAKIRRARDLQLV